MDIHTLLALFDRQQRIDIEYPEARKEVLPHVVRFVRPAPAMNFVLHSRLDAANADQVIREQIAYFTRFDQPFEWKAFDHDSPPDLKDRLVAHGFERDDDPGAVMVLEPGEVATRLPEPAAGVVRRITSRHQLDDVIRILETVHEKNFDPLRNRLGGHLEIPGYLSLYVIDVGGQPACSGWIYFHPNSQFASLWGGSTVGEHRGRGLYTAMLAVRVQEAVRRGYRYVTVDAGPMSRPILARHGFQVLTYAHALEWRRPEAPS